MSTTISFYGIKPPDEKWKKMKSVYDSCEEAGISIPTEVDDFFDGDVPSDLGVTVYLPKDMKDGVVREQVINEYFGHTIDLEKISKDFKYIRVEYS